MIKTFALAALILLLPVSAFAAVNVSVTQASGGLVSISIGTATSTVGYNNLATGTRVSVTALPNNGYSVTAILVNNSAVAGTAGPNNSMSYSFNATATVSVSAVFGIVPYINASLSSPVTSVTGNAITTVASASTNAGASTLRYAFSATDGAGHSFNQPASTSNSFTFTPTVAGTYTITLTVSTTAGTVQNSQTAAVSVVSSVGSSNGACLGCHGSSSPLVVSLYNSSRHYNITSCQDCHTASPHTAALPTSAVCAGCHLDSSGNVPLHPVDMGTNPCVICHDAHSVNAGFPPGVQNLHYNNITSGVYPASYVTARSACTDCHFPSADNTSIRHYWYSSAHAATRDLPWTTNDFKTRSACVQCHTTTGFIAYSTGKVTAAWGNAADKTKEVLTCKGCHSDIGTGTVRKVVPISPYGEDPGYVNPDLGESNICMDCHSGRKNGKSIATLLTANTDLTNWTLNNSHFMPAGGTTFGVVGYHFPGRSYVSGTGLSHRQIGMGNGYNTGFNGPCVGCHKNSVFNHRFNVSAAVPVCANCHGSSMTDAKLAVSKAAFANALGILKAELAVKGYVYQPVSPYFTNTNWGSGQAGADTMGAAFNFLVFTFDPGAYAHNPTYAKQLILDSIDYLDNGVIDNSVETLALPNLAGANLISQAAVSSLASYKADSTCITCHGGTAASAAPMASNAHGAHLTGSYGPGSLLGTALSSCQTCHVYNSTQPDPLHMNGIADLVGGSCNGCHPGTVPVWTAGARLACTSCHAAAPSVLPNGVAAPYKASFTSTGHGRFAASSQCTACHDPNSSHISGVLGTTVRLSLSNDNGQCFSCHNGTVARTMATHVLDKNTVPTPSLCKTCHDVHGTSNLHMIRTVINGTPITFTNMSTGFVKTSAPYDGLCQTCHTLTNHYRAGVAETGHPVKYCLGCHPHTGAQAFRPAGNCDSCHGYPPAPPGFVPGQGNYSSARQEDYLHGGGAHTVAGHISKSAKPSDGWLHCAICHSNGSLSPATHLMTPVPAQQQNVTIDVDDFEKFNSALSLTRNMYTGPLNGSGTTGKCFNTGCHFGPSPLWAK